MTTAITASRYSKTADTPGPAIRSPFRSAHPLRRIIAAEAMVAKRQSEFAGLRRLLAGTGEVKIQQRLTLRLLACQNNLDAWLAYLGDETPRETRAVIIP